MSHELRTPLNAIAGHIELLEMELHGTLTGAQREALQRVARNQRHLLSLINDVLNLTRLERGALSYHPEAFALCDLLGEVRAVLHPLVAARDLRCAVVDDQTECHVVADRDKAMQILVNLLSNAAKYTAPGGIIRVDTSVEDGHALLRVTDTGIGINPRMLDTIFEPFVQLGTIKLNQREGLGVGLSISRHLARGMGGDLTVSSAPGVGSTFMLSLPLAAA